MRAKFAFLGLVLLLFLTGCGGPKADVPIFMMSASGIPSEVGDKLEADLKAKVGEAPTIKIQTTPIFSMEKLVVEIAAGDNGIIVIPMEQFKALGQQGGYVSLDDVAKSEDFPEGVLELPVDNKDKNDKTVRTEKHLYGLPLENSKWFKDLKLNGKGLVAFVPANAKKQDLVLQVMKVIAQK
jgi:ABC-type glycerol-3-phosphate transport system substrate-binding protein